MFVRFRAMVCLLVLFGVRSGPAQELSHQGLPAGNVSTTELLYFFDESRARDSQSGNAIKVAIESGLRIRQVGVKRFPELAKRFQVMTLPSLVLLRQNRMVERHEGRFKFARILELFAKGRENRVQRRDQRRDLLEGQRKIPGRGDWQPSKAPIAPRYIQTTTSTPVSSTSSEVQPVTVATGVKPLDRDGRFPVAQEPTSSEKKAYDATVRLRVIDRGGTSHGSGTVIHSQGNDALVLTCGHIFRESSGKGQIEADLFLPGGEQTVSGTLISYDALAHDIAILAIRTSRNVNVPAVRLASLANVEQHHADVFTLGCDQGKMPTIRRSHYKRHAIYDGVEKYDVYGRPIDGRSGGGLFNRNGELIGVCNAAAVHVNEGIYSGLKTIYHRLAITRLLHLFERRSESQVSPRVEPGSPASPLAAAPSSSPAFVSLPAAASLVNDRPSNEQPTNTASMKDVSPKTRRTEQGQTELISLDDLPHELADQVRAFLEKSRTRATPRIPAFPLFERF